MNLVIFHGFGSSLSNPRYTQLGIPFTGVPVDYQKLSVDKVYEIYDEIVLKALKLEDEPIILGHSLGGWWARLFAKKYHTKAVLLNPVYSVSMITSEETLPLVPQYSAYEPFKGQGYLLYYIELGDEVLNFRPYLNEIKNEGYMELIEGGHHRIQYPENIPIMLSKAENSLIL